MQTITRRDFLEEGDRLRSYRTGLYLCPICSQDATDCEHVEREMYRALRGDPKPQFAPPFERPQGLAQDSAGRKRQPMFRGLLAYFSDALAAVSEVSYLGNEKHNPGEPMLWARTKSGDELDCVVRHAAESGTPDDPGRYILDEHGQHEYGTPVLHSVALAWRALANAQKEIEALKGDGKISRGSK